MSDLKEYIITLNTHNDLDEFYTDMETLRPSMYGVMPERAVDCFFRRPSSRNTHYKLTQEEADKLKEDPRVLAIELSPDELGLKVTPVFSQTSAYWDKSTTKSVNAHRNWGLYRCSLTGQISGWGSDNTPTKSGTVTTTASGKNVDVVICDGHINPSHPEYAVNTDGTGGSRVNQFNWFLYNPQVIGIAPGTYVYTPYTDPADPDITGDNNHGAHVAGTACGNTQGWARDANIYNISPYGTNPNSITGSSNITGNLYISVFDFIRQFHLQKSINPETGLKNPTVVNNSWGLSGQLMLSNITKIFHNGVVNNAPTVNDFIFAGLPVFGNATSGYYTVYTGRSASITADAADCIADGIIMIGAAGNSYTRGAKLSSDSGYNDYIVYLGVTLYYGRGSSPGADMINVGAVDNTSNEYKGDYSNCGPAVDIFAPGTSIISSVNDTTSFGGTYDYRSASYYLSKINGTSMASPQVTGVVACFLETYPTFNQADVLKYLQEYGFKNQMGDSGNYPYDDSDLQGSPNLYLRYRLERPLTGPVYPKVNNNIRATSGQVYPRPRVYRWGPQI